MHSKSLETSKDAQGNVVYEIAGRWNSQLVARAVGTGDGMLHPDVTVSPSGTSLSVCTRAGIHTPLAEHGQTGRPVQPHAVCDHVERPPEDTLKPSLVPDRLPPASGPASV